MLIAFFFRPHGIVQADARRLVWAFLSQRIVLAPHVLLEDCGSAVYSCHACLLLSYEACLVVAYNGSTATPAQVVFQMRIMSAPNFWSMASQWFSDYTGANELSAIFGLKENDDSQTCEAQKPRKETIRFDIQLFFFRIRFKVTIRYSHTHNILLSQGNRMFARLKTYNSPFFCP